MKYPIRTLILTALLSSSHAIAAERPPNFIFILSDDIAQELIQNDMIRWLKANAEKPFFMFYAITLPHARHEIDDFGLYKDKPWSKLEKTYAAQVTRVDSDVGELLDTLRELGIDRNTLIIFSGDNGSSFPPESEIGKRFNQASNGLRGYKRGLYEGALRQAAIAWWPGTVPAGRVDEQPWAFWDLMPTFVELSGATPPEGYETDGLSLVEYLKAGNRHGKSPPNAGKPDGCRKTARRDRGNCHHSRHTHSVNFSLRRKSRSVRS